MRYVRRFYWKYFNDAKKRVFVFGINFFKRVYAVEHLRYIMQYRRRKMRRFMTRYQEVLEKAKE